MRLRVGLPHGSYPSGATDFPSHGGRDTSGPQWRLKLCKVTKKSAPGQIPVYPSCNVDTQYAFYSRQYAFSMMLLEKCSIKPSPMPGHISYQPFFQ